MEYYIQNRDAGFLGNAILFWGQNRSGYTADINKSHKFTEEEAKGICQGNPEKNRAWSVEYIDNNEGIQKIVDSQYLDSSKVKNFNESE